jgi:hypothetical protein
MSQAKDRTDWSASVNRGLESGGSKNVKDFILSVTYVPKFGNGAKRIVSPQSIVANDELEASRAGSAVADFAYSELASSVLVRVLTRDGSRSIAEIRRPKAA